MVEQTTTEDGAEDCQHQNAEHEYMERAGREVVFWVNCPDCDAYFTISADLVDETAHISRD